MRERGGSGVREGEGRVGNGGNGWGGSGEVGKGGG